MKTSKRYRVSIGIAVAFGFLALAVDVPWVKWPAIVVALVAGTVWWAECWRLQDAAGRIEVRIDEEQGGDR